MLRRRRYANPNHARTARRREREQYYERLEALLDAGDPRWDLPWEQEG